jgi:hypothetical protein
MEWRCLEFFKALERLEIGRKKTFGIPGRR